MAKKKSDGPLVVEARDAGEARVMEAARRAYRLAQQKLHDARDPADVLEGTIRGARRAPVDGVRRLAGSAAAAAVADTAD